MSFHQDIEITGHAGPIFSIDIDNQFIYTGGTDKIVARWSPLDGKQDNFTIKFDNPVYSICRFNNVLVVGLNNGDIHVFDVEERKELKYFRQHKSGILSLYYDTIFNRLYVGDMDGYFSAWNVNTWSLLITLPLNCGKIRSIQIDEQILVCGQDGCVRVLSRESFSELHKFNAHFESVNCILASKEYYVTGGKDAYLKLWSKDFRLIKSVPAHNYAIYRVVKCGEQLISVSRDKTIKIWNEDLEIVQRLDSKCEGHRNSVNDVKVINKSSFATCSDDGRVLIWTRAKEDKR